MLHKQRYRTSVQIFIKWSANLLSYFSAQGNYPFGQNLLLLIFYLFPGWRFSKRKFTGQVKSNEREENSRISEDIVSKLISGIYLPITFDKFQVRGKPLVIKPKYFDGISKDVFTHSREVEDIYDMEALYGFSWRLHQLCLDTP